MNISHESSPHRRPPLPAWRLFFSIIALLTLGVTAQAATYFVKNGGNDNLDGLSDANAWATMGKVNGRTFAAGDVIQFKRGSIWTGTGLVVPSSGTAGNLIVFCAYGTGNKPQINDTTSSGVIIDGRSHVRVEDISASRNGNLGVQIDRSNFVTILRVDVADNGTNAGINASFGGNVVIDGCTVTNGKSNAIQFKGTATDQIHDSIIQNCVVNGTLANDGIVIHSGATSSDNVGSNFILRNNRAENCFEQGFDITTGTNILLEDNISQNNRSGAITIGHTASQVTVRRHSSRNEPTNGVATLILSGPNVTVEYSKFVGSSSANKPVVWIKPGSDSQPEDVKLLNNVFVWNLATEGNLFKMETAAGWPNVTIQRLTMKNNIFTTATNATGVINFEDSTRPPNYTSFDIDNNLYYSPAAGGAKWLVAGVAKTFAQYRALTPNPPDASGIEANPRFVNLAGEDFHLQTSPIASPAINAGVAVVLTQAVDFDLQAVPQGGAPEIGIDEIPAGGSSAPSAPTGLTASAPSSSTINLNWTDTSNNETGFEVDRALNSAFSSGLVTDAYTTGANATGTTATGLAASTTYYFRARATNGSGDSANSNTANATTQSGGGGGLPSPWVNADIGAVAAAGSASHSSGTFTVNGSGADIYGTADEFHYVYQPVSGDCSITALVSSVENTNTWAKGGVMIRETLAANSRNAAVVARPDSKTSFQYRTTVGGTTTYTTPAGAAPSWVRVTRVGNTFTGYRSTNGTSWTQIGTATIAMGASAFVGLPVTSHADGNVCTSTISNVSVTGGGANSVPSITTTTLPGTIAGEAYSQTLAATGGDGALVWSLDSGALPAGLSLSTAGVISGSATTAGTANFTVRVADSDGVTGAGDEDTQALSIVVTANSVPSITTTTLPGTITGEAYSQTLAATGGNGSLTWSVSAGALPAGLSLSSGGVISGNATTAGTSNFTVKVADSDGVTGAGDEDTQALSIVVTANSVPAITTTTLPAGTVGTAYSQTLAATGGNGTLVWSLDSVALPAGLSLSSGGVISGTPTTAATSNFTVKVADSDGNTGAVDEDTQALSIVINSGANPNLAPNPGFETDPTVNYTTTGTATFTWASDFAHGGTRSIKNVSTQPNGTLTRWLSKNTEIATTAGANHTTTAWLKWSGIAGGGTGSRAVITVTYINSSQVGIGYFSSSDMTGSGGWTQFTVPSTAPTGTAYMRVEFRLYGPGTLWVDDVSVIQN